MLTECFWVLRHRWLIKKIIFTPDNWVRCEGTFVGHASIFAGHCPIFGGNIQVWNMHSRWQIRKRLLQNVLSSRYSEKSQEFKSKTPARHSISFKATGNRPSTLLKKKSVTGVFLWPFPEKLFLIPMVDCKYFRTVARVLKLVSF